MFANIVNFTGKRGVIMGVSESNILKHVYYFDKSQIDEVNLSLPTMFVGYEFTKGIFGDIDILSPKVDGKIYWTFSPEESMMHFLDRAALFVESIPDALVDGLEYTSLDPIFRGEGLSERIDNVINGTELGYYRNNHYFLYSKGKVYGLPMALLQVYGFDTDHINNMLSHKKIITDPENKVFNFFITVMNYNRDLVERYIPYLITLKKNASPAMSIQKEHVA
jgi:hypothetical protein